MEKEYLVKIPTIEEMERKWNYEIDHTQDKHNWIIWKKDAILRAERNQIIPYYGFLDDQIICEATAAIDPNIVQNNDQLADDKTAYLFAFRTIPEYRHQGYFSKLFKYMINDLQTRGYTRFTLGVEPKERKNLSIYKKYNFNKYIKTCHETYPDGTKVEVDYYLKEL